MSARGSAVGEWGTPTPLLLATDQAMGPSVTEDEATADVRLVARLACGRPVLAAVCETGDVASVDAFRHEAQGAERPYCFGLPFRDLSES